jgi:phosphoribosylformylglycinamidine synthase
VNVVDAQVAREHGLTEGEWKRVLQGLGRTPTWVELGVISVMWSEHCSYKSSRRHLKKLPTTAPWVLQGPGENAGVIDLGQGLAAAFKMESHNHPSFIEPFQGAATGVGGILRDVFTMGARPVANLNSLRFGRPDAPRMKFLVSGVVAGIGAYGNCMGVPTVGGEIAFDATYDGNILVNAFTLGLLRADRIFRSAAAGIGSPVVYVGSKTGRDGIHGATMASEEFGADSDAKRPRVQVGDPFTEKKLLEACLELMQEDAIIAIQDMGAAGLTSSSCEMASKGEVGIEIDVSKVPRREEGMTPYEIMLSESQERMLMVVRPGTEAVVKRIFDKWALSSAVIGEVTDTQRVVVTDGAQTVASLPVTLLVDAAPNYDRPHHPPSNLADRWVEPDPQLGDPASMLIQLLGRPTITSKRWAYEQYDFSVRASTVSGPGHADAAVVRLTDLDLRPSATEERGVAMTVDMNGRFVFLDPFRGAALGVIEACRNLACVGARPKALTDCLNFGNPEKPEVMWSFVQSLEGMAEACRELSTPVVSGNVSLYNETEGRPILPTPTVGVVGLVDRIGHVPGSAFRHADDAILLLGDPSRATWAGSELALMQGCGLTGRPVEPHYAGVRALVETMVRAVGQGWLHSAHDASEGGLLTALAECCVTDADAMLGADIDASLTPRQWLGEGSDVIVVSLPEARVAALEDEARTHGCPVRRLGRVGGERLRIHGWMDASLTELGRAFHEGLELALGR